MTSLGQKWLAEHTKKMQLQDELSSMNKVYQEQKRIELQQKREETAEQKRLMRLIQMKENELEMERALIKSVEEKEVRERQQRQEELVAKELERIRLDRLRDEKTRQQVRDGSYELRELESKLREAYVAKERAAQIAEKQALDFDRQMEEASIMRALKEEHERADRLAKEYDAKRANNKGVYKQELENQLAEEEVKRQQAYQEFLRDKMMIDEIVRKIYEEDDREKERELRKKHATQEYIKEFQAARSQWKALEKARMEAENVRMQEFVVQQDARASAQEMTRKAREGAMLKVQEQIMDAIAKREKERKEMEEIRQELVLEQEEEKARMHEQWEREKRDRQRNELQRDELIQRQAREEQKRKLAEEEERFRHNMLAKFAEDERLEQMSEQKRRMRQLEHKRAVEQLLQERRLDAIHQRDREAEELAEANRKEEWRRKIIEEERQRLLRDHAYNLLGYLPRGVIQSEKDLEFLGSDFKEEYRKRVVDPFGDEEINKYNNNRRK